MIVGAVIYSDPGETIVISLIVLLAFMVTFAAAVSPGHKTSTVGSVLHCPLKLSQVSMPFSMTVETVTSVSVLHIGLFVRNITGFFA